MLITKEMNIQCNMEICEECRNKHSNHITEKIDNKNIFLKKDFVEFEKFIINNENKKREILNKVKEKINYLENNESINKDEFNKIIKK